MVRANYISNFKITGVHKFTKCHEKNITFSERVSYWLNTSWYTGNGLLQGYLNVCILWWLDSMDSYIIFSPAWQIINQLLMKKPYWLAYGSVLYNNSLVRYSVWEADSGLYTFSKWWPGGSVSFDPVIAEKYLLLWVSI